MSTTYAVTIDLKTVGSLDIGKGASAKGPEKAMSLIKSGWKDIESASSSVMGVLDGAVDKMGAFAKAGLVAAGIAGAGAIYYGVKDLNSELESTRISLGTIFAANGIASSVPAGMQHASDIIKTMRQDAKALPGELGDLKNIFTTGAIDANRAGANPEQWEKVAAKVMASSKVAEVPTDVASREFAQLMEGRAGAHNVLGSRLFGLTGDRAQSFNKESEAQRFKDLSKELDKYGASIEQFGQSFEGQSSSLIDNGKNLLRQTTEPLFNVIKGELTGVNKWFDDNEASVGSWSQYIGQELVVAFQAGKDEILLWYPAIKDFSVNAFSKLKEVWLEIGPTVEAVGSSIRDALKDPGTLDKIIHLLELWAGLKVAGGVVGAVGIAAKFGGGALEVANGLKNGSVGGQIKEELGLASAAAKGTKAVGKGAAEGGGFGVQGVMIGAAIASLTLAYSAYEELAAIQKSSAEQAAGAGYAFGTSLYNDIESINQHADKQASYSDAVESWAQRMDESGNDQEAAFIRLNAATIAATAALENMAGNAGDKRASDIGDEASANLLMGITQQNKNFLHGDPNAKKAPAVGGGHGGTSIQKVEIVVTSNQSPSRVARVVYDQLGKLSRNPRSSSYTPNYASLEPGT